MQHKRICIVSSYPMSLHRGGLDIQAERTYEELCIHDRTYDYEFFDWRAHHVADAYHFFGTPPHLWEIMASIRELKKPYLVHLLSGRRQTFLNTWMRDRAKRWTGFRCNSRILNDAALVAMITERERTLLTRVFGIDPDKTAVIPHVVDDAFYESTPDVWQKRWGDRPFLLCVGIVQERKNQLLLARASNTLKLPLVLIGPPIIGERAYAEQVGRAMEENETYGGTWIQGLDQKDPLLISAHRACRAYVLLSKAETQPLSILQAMAAERPVLLGKSFYSESEPFCDLKQVDLRNFDEICAGLKEVWDNGVVKPLSERYRPRNNVAELVKLYQRVLDPLP